jgi:hypothetical protein
MVDITMNIATNIAIVDVNMVVVDVNLCTSCNSTNVPYE